MAERESFSPDKLNSLPTEQVAVLANVLFDLLPDIKAQPDMTKQGKLVLLENTNGYLQLSGEIKEALRTLVAQKNSLQQLISLQQAAEYLRNEQEIDA